MQNAPTPENEIQLIQDFKEGKDHAQRKILNLFHKKIVFFAQRMTRSQFDSEEIASDIFMKLFNKHADFETLVSIKAFLYISTRNACLNWLTKNERGNDKMSIVPLTENSPTHDIAVYDDPFRGSTEMELIARIEVLLEFLPARCKEIFIRHYIRRESVPDIASALDLEPGTVYRQLEIGRNRIRAGFLLTILFIIYLHFFWN